MYCGCRWKWKVRTWSRWSPEFFRWFLLFCNVFAYSKFLEQRYTMVRWGKSKFQVAVKIDIAEIRFVTFDFFYTPIFCLLCYATNCSYFFNVSCVPQISEHRYTMARCKNSNFGPQLKSTLQKFRLLYLLLHVNIA